MFYSNISKKGYFSFLLLPRKIGVCHKKRNKKRAPAKITSIAGETLIELKYYCELKFSSLIIATHCLKPIFNSASL